MGKWEQWYESLPESTKVYLSKQPIWHDRDMFKAFAMGILVGVLVGLVM